MPSEFAALMRLSGEPVTARRAELIQAAGRGSVGFGVDAGDVDQRIGALPGQQNNIGCDSSNRQLFVSTRVG